MSVMNKRHKDILDKAVKSRTDKVEIDISKFSTGRSFSRIAKIDDIYCGYIQFRTLHRTFCTNKIFFKIGIKDNYFCNLCYDSEDSNEHMLLECQLSKHL